MNNENTQANIYINELWVSKINNYTQADYQNTKNKISIQNKNNVIEKKKICKEKYFFCFCK